MKNSKILTLMLAVLMLFSTMTPLLASSTGDVTPNKDDNTITVHKTIIKDKNNKKEDLIKNTGDNLNEEIKKDTSAVEFYDPAKYGDVEFSLYELTPEEISLMIKNITDDKNNDLKKLKDELNSAEKTTEAAKKEEIIKNIVMSALSKKEISMKLAEYAEEKLDNKDAKIKLDGATISPVDTKSVAATVENKIVTDSKLTFKNTYDLKENRTLLIVETKAPTTVTAKAKPFIVQLPMTDDNGTGYKKGELHFYPKNRAERPTFKIVKHKQENNETEEQTKALEAAKFVLFKGIPGEANNTKVNKDLITNATGNIELKDLVVGKYYLAELESDKVEGRALTDKSYMIRPEYKNNVNNNLRFEYKADGKIVILNKDGSEPAEGETADSKLKKMDDGSYKIINYAKPTLKKNILDKENGTEVDKNEHHSYNYNEIIPYKVAITVPADINEYAKFALRDVYDKNLDIDLSSIKLKIGTKEYDKTAIDGIDGALESNPTDNSFTINFYKETTEEADKKDNSKRTFAQIFTDSPLKQGTEIVVTYNATIKNGAPLDKALENTATLKFNNGYGILKDKDDDDPDGPPKEPENPDGDKEIEDKEKVYTHGFIFKKIDGSILKPSDLAGAEFIVKKDDKGTTFYLKETADGKFEWTTTKTDAKKYVSSADGKIDVKGLKVGSYTLEEIKAPKDYELPLNPNTKFEVTEDKKSGDTVIESSYKKTTKTPEIIKNMKKNRPFTGYERATLTFAVLAIVLASAFVLRKKLMKNNVR